MPPARLEEKCTSGTAMTLTTLIPGSFLRAVDSVLAGPSRHYSKIRPVEIDWKPLAAISYHQEPTTQPPPHGRGGLDDVNQKIPR